MGEISDKPEEYSFAAAEEGGNPPMGILFLGSFIESKGYDIRIFDLSFHKKIDPLIYYEKILRKNDFDVIGFSVMTSQILNVIKMAKIAKNFNPNIFIICGGISATFLDKDMLENIPEIDFIIRGEGEFPLLELLAVLENNNINSRTYYEKLKGIKGLSFRDQSKNYHRNDDAPIIKDLDKLPFPNRNLLKNNYSLLIGDLRVISGKMTSFLTSRGCPYNCTYCSCGAFRNRRCDMRSPENIAEEIEYMANEGFKEIMIVDDQFFLNKKRTLKICKLIKKLNYDLNFYCESRVDSIDLEVIRNSVEMGMKAIFFGFESGSQRILDYYNKKITVQDSLQAVKTCKKGKVNFITAGFMYGAPGETLEDMQRTTDLYVKSGIDAGQFAIVSIFPGTQMWTDALKVGFLPKNAWKRQNIFASEVYPADKIVKLDVLKKIVNQSYRQLFDKWQFLIKQFFSFMFNPYKRKLLFNLVKKQGVKKIRKTMLANPFPED
jgi:radical SAM superfamily enzyme YgiQ (UPF0313 family)